MAIPAERPTSNRDEILRAVKALFQPGDVVELRALYVSTPTQKYPHTEHGYFSDWDALADRAAWLGQYAPAVYFTLNAVDQRLLHRAKNKLASELGNSASDKKLTTSDKDITRYRYLLVDCDPKRPTDISSSEREHDAARFRAEEVRHWLKAFGWPEPVVADSGNGYHLLYRIDLAANEANTALIKQVFAALALRFGDGEVAIDETVLNPARICKLYGTVAGSKGDDTAERPHRMSQLLSVPERLHEQLVTPEQLQAIAATVPETPRPEPRGAKAHDSPYDMDALIERHPDRLEVKREGTWGNKGRKWVLRCCPFDDSHTDSSAVLTLVGGVPGFRCHHNQCSGKGIKDLWNLLGEAPRQRSGADEDGDTKPKGRSDQASTRHTVLLSSLVGMDTIETRPVAWLWEGYIPLGKVTMLDGDPGGGKTTLTMDLAARVTTGRALPDGASSTPGGVVLVSVEDDLSDTLRPRLEAAGANMSCIVAIPSVKAMNSETGAEYERAFSVVSDLWLLEAAIQQVEAKLVVIDPIMACLGQKLDAYRDQDVRTALTPLKLLAERLGVAIVIIRHLTKGGSDNPLYRGGGSIGFIGAARSGLMLVRHPDNDALRLLVPTKNNLAAAKPPLQFHIETAPNGVGRLAWDGPSTMTAREVFAASQQSETQQDIVRAVQDARGPVGPKEVSEATGIKEATCRVLMQRLERRGTLRRVAYGKYLPALEGVSSVSLVSPVSHPDQVNGSDQGSDADNRRRDTAVTGATRDTDSNSAPKDTPTPLPTQGLSDLKDLWPLLPGETPRDRIRRIQTVWQAEMQEANARRVREAWEGEVDSTLWGYEHGDGNTPLAALHQELNEFLHLIEEPRMKRADFVAALARRGYKVKKIHGTEVVLDLVEKQYGARPAA